MLPSLVGGNITYVVAPPNSDIQVVQGAFVSRQAEPRISLEPSIDVLPESIAREAGALLTQMRERGHDVTVSVNINPIRLHEHDLVRQLKDISGGLLSGWTIEVTETGAYGDEDVVRSSLEALCGLGARSSLDDFGTGYSSVSHLKSWGFDDVKIDRAFVQDVELEDSRLLVSTMVAMAHALGAQAIAEGVETSDQVDILNRIGVDLLQGFYFARPMPAAAVLDWLESQMP